MENQVTNENLNTNFVDDLKNQSVIKVLSIGSIILNVLGIIFLVIWIITLINSTVDDGLNQDPLMSSLMAMIIVFVTSIISSILTLIASIMVLACKWNSKKLNDAKLLWGLLAFFVLGAIGTLVFACLKIEQNNSHEN